MAYKTKELGARSQVNGKKRNKILSKTRYKVERIFGGIKKWFKSGLCRYIGEVKTHGQHVLEAICYNIKISPGVLFQSYKIARQDYYTQN